MKLLTTLLGLRREKRKTLKATKEEMIERSAREQFKKLQKLGLSVPVALL